MGESLLRRLHLKMKEPLHLMWRKSHTRLRAAIAEAHGRMHLKYCRNRNNASDLECRVDGTKQDRDKSELVSGGLAGNLVSTTSVTVLEESATSGHNMHVHTYIHGCPYP